MLQLNTVCESASTPYIAEASNMFQKAVKYESKLRLALAGPSGSGKTYTALAAATSLIDGGRVAVVDTEHSSASKYADLFSFDVLNLTAPFHPDKYISAIEDAANSGYDVLVVDSLSHAWNGPGGLLELVDQISKRYKGNTYAAWSEATPIQNQLIEAITSTDLHLIGTMRSKQDYVMVEKNGKNIPQKVGLAPVQRDGFEYEFDVFIDMDIENNAVVMKTRCQALTGRVFSKPGADLAEILRDWLTGAAAPPAPAYGDGSLVDAGNPTEIQVFQAYASQHGEPPADRQAARLFYQNGRAN